MLFFDTIVKRVVVFSQESYDTNKNNILDFFIKNEKFQFSVLTSSRSLYDDIKKEKTNKVTGSLEKYFMRSHFNSTPFGVFSSVGVLKWGDNTKIIKSNPLLLSIKFDNSFLSTKVNQSDINDCLKYEYFTNPTIHFLNDEKIGFYKSKILIDSRVEISYVEVDFDDDLQWLINKFKKGLYLNTVLDELEATGFIKEEIENYLLEIIEAGIIINDFLFSPINNKIIKSNNQFISSLIEKSNHSLNSKSEIAAFAKEYADEQVLHSKYNDNQKTSHSLVSYEIESGTLDKNIKEKIIKFINFSAKIGSENKPINDKLIKFSNKISDHYNDGFIPLLDVFNPYSGLKYSDINIEKKTSLHKDIVSKILTTNKKELFLNFNDYNDYKKTNLPATFSVVLEVLKCKLTGNEIIYFKNIGGSSAINLISRFENTTNTLCKEIVTFESNLNKNCIQAEVNCISNLQTLNISPSQHYFEHSIPINTSNSSSNSPVLLSDLYLYLKGNNITLVSRNHKKQVIPKLMSAINFRISDSEIYNFLIELESQNHEFYGVNFNLNNYINFFKPFVSRIYLENNILLYPAQILLVDDEFDFEKFEIYLNLIIIEFEFTKKIIFNDIKGDLVLDTRNKNHIQLLFNKLKEKKYFYVSECLYDLFFPKIENEEGHFAHELIVSVKNTHYSRLSVDFSEMDFSIPKKTYAAVVSDWLYLELFCNSYADSEILNTIYNKIILENKTDQFFFVNYANPERHLRLRFKNKSTENKQFIISVIHELKLKNIISKYHILTYEPEIGRYGGEEMMQLSEIIFDIDSRDFLKNVINKNLVENDIKIVAILKIKFYMYFFNLTIDDSINFCENSVKNYSKEFELTSQIRKDFNKEYADIKIDLMKYDYENFFQDDSFKMTYHNQFQISKPDTYSSIWPLIHMSMNRHFNKEQRFNEFKTYYFTKLYLNQLKFTQK